VNDARFLSFREQYAGPGNPVPSASPGATELRFAAVLLFSQASKRGRCASNAVQERELDDLVRDGFGAGEDARNKRETAESLHPVGVKNHTQSLSGQKRHVSGVALLGRN
jgi:hypothetical protein